MPFLVKIEIKKSTEYEEGGHTLIAAQDIPTGTKIWCFKCADGETAIPVINNTEPHIELKENACYNKEEMEKLPEERIKAILWGGYPHVTEQKFIELLDGGQYTNHSENPNCGGPWSDVVEGEASWAVRDIKAGEEILDDYGVFHDSMVPWADDLMQKYQPDRHEFEANHVKALEIGQIIPIPSQSSISDPVVR